jgi:hypothetical protein
MRAVPSPADGGMTPQRRRVLFAGALLGGTLVYFHRAVFSGRVFFARDIQRVYYPLKTFWREQVLAGSFPGWYPFDAMGQPFAGMTISGAFHPSNLLFLVFEPTTALKLNVLACFPLAFIGVWLFLKQRGLAQASAVSGALVFSVSGYMLSMMNNLLYLSAAATLPWVLFSAEKAARERSPRWAAVSSLFLASILLVGDPQTFSVALAVVVLWLLIAVPSVGDTLKRRGAWLGVGFVLTLLLCGAQWVCSRQVMGDGLSGQSSLSSAQVWSLHPLRALDLLFGNVFAISLSGQVPLTRVFQFGAFGFWADSLFVGVPTLALAAWGFVGRRNERDARLAAVLLVGTLLLALGKHLPFYALVFELLPPWRVFRYPEKLFPHVLLWLSFLTAHGVERALALDARGRRVVAAVVGALAVVTALSVVGAKMGLFTRALEPLYSGPLPPWERAVDELDARMTSAMTQTALFTLVLALLLWRGTPRALTFGLPLLIGAMLFVVCEPTYVLADPDIIGLKPAFATTMEEKEGGSPLGRARVYAEKNINTLSNPPPEGLSLEEQVEAEVANALLPATAARYGVESANSYLPAISTRMGRLFTEPGPRFRFLVNASYRVSESTGGADSPHTVAKLPAFGLELARGPSLPRARLARPRCVGSMDEATALLRTPGFALEEEAAVECREPLPASASGPLGTARIERYMSDRVEVLTQASQPAVLVLADAYYSGWSARIDDQPADILPANVALRAVAVPAGEHRVVFEYRTPHLKLGVAATVLGLLACCALLVWGNRRKASPVEVSAAGKL